ncbi:DUF2785 domain-containing protein [Virgibacillus doumboii]|uniref:DUF2785 domain-containing protein n=1 Tax=Virgibacillus doumboii TaxID=2697503 RepID=UPI0013DF2A4D|nr:DUF2785 domain-containing protein [Virgibacillus doumboii]
MNKQFWQSLRATDYKIPTGFNISELTEELKGYLGSTDPVLRDEIAFPTICEWMDRDYYSKEEMKQLMKEMMLNLKSGLGERETDTVFLRSFSVLILMGIVEYDNERQILGKEDVHTLLKNAVEYFNHEHDLRGYVPEKGWAHSTAHAADLLGSLARNRRMEEMDLQHILMTIQNKLMQKVNHTYAAAEDERLAFAVFSLLRRELVELSFVEQWLRRFSTFHGNKWLDHLDTDGGGSAYTNTKGFLRSLYFQILLNEDSFKAADECLSILIKTVKDINSWVYELD